VAAHYGEGLWSMERLERLNMRDTSGNAPAQEGFGQSVLGSHMNQRTEWSQQQAPTDLGRTNVFDEQFAQRNGDYGPHPGDGRPNPAGNWNALWAHPQVIRGGQQNRYEWDFLTAHGAVEDVILHRQSGNHAPPGQAYVLPTEKPPTMISMHGPLLW
jgi:hypothetical protein